MTAPLPYPVLLQLTRLAGGVLYGINPFAHTQKHGAKRKGSKKQAQKCIAKDVPGSVRSLFVVAGNERHIKPDIIKLSGLF